MFHFLTAFPINAAEQEKYYILNVLKKPQCVNVRQIVRPVEQLNAYITQMPCFYYSPNANASTKPKNVPFTEAELGSLYVPYPVTGPLQYEQEGHDTNGHVLASDFVGIDLTHLHLQEGQIGIFWEVFQQGQEREEAPRYQFYGQGSQESRLWEELRPVQEAWERVYHAQHSWLLYVQKGQKGEIRIPRD